MKILPGKCKKLSAERHFTLIELLIVIAIIAILAAMRMPSLGKTLPPFLYSMSRLCVSSNPLSAENISLNQMTSDFEARGLSQKSSGGR